MNPVDYDRIAETYDTLAIRNRIAPDERLAARLHAQPSSRRVLDVGCGTGTWLATQSDALGPTAASWFGADPSSGMLARARAKAPHATFVVATAESLPFPDGHFAFVATRFTFHHFVDKPRALDELRRVLEPGGVLHLTNVAPERMPDWWVFRWFPEASAENARYWPADTIRDELAARGFDVALDVRAARSDLPLADVVAQARVRDQSHLVTLDDVAYARGLSALEEALARDPAGTTPSETAVIHLYATRA